MKSKAQIRREIALLVSQEYKKHKAIKRYEKMNRNLRKFKPAPLFNLKDIFSHI